MDKQTEQVETISAQIVELDAQIDRLRDKAASGTFQAESDYSGAISALQLKRDKAAATLQGIAPTSDSEWKDITKGSEDTMGEIRSIFSDAITKIN